MPSSLRALPTSLRVLPTSVIDAYLSRHILANYSSKLYNLSTPNVLLDRLVLLAIHLS